MKSQHFILTGFIFIIFMFIAYIGIFIYQLKAPLKAEYWIQHSYEYKDYKANNIKQKKIIIISGSNSLFSINSKTIQDVTGYKVVNLAVHVGLDIDFLYFKLQNSVKEGDIVVMPLEYGYYSKTKMTDWFSNNMMTWGIDYLKQLSFIEKTDFFISSEPNRILQGFFEQIKSKSINNKVLSQKEVLDTLKKLWTEGEKWRGYSYKSLNKYGDINVDKAVQYSENESYISDSMQISEHFLKIFHKIEKLVKKHNGILFLTHPVTIRNNNFDLSNSESQNKINNLNNLLKNHNIELQCNAALFNLDRVYFFNSYYHPNKYGAIIRSENLGDCLNNYLKKNKINYSYKEAISRTNKLQKKYNQIVKKTNSYIRLNDISEIKKALNNYYKQFGEYPKSKGFDGLFTKWGESSQEWIKGLIPVYIKSLPRDPRKNNNDGQQYLYKSNGKDYKLISHNPEDCKKVKKLNPSIIDPKRDCSAYGYWTEGAKNW